MKKANITLGLVISTILVGALIFGIIAVRSQSPSGLAFSESENYAKNLNHIINEFFDTAGIYFPSGSCTFVAEELFNNIAPERIDTTSGYETTGREKLATWNFVVGRTTHFGTMDLVKGKSLIGARDANSFISFNTETVVRVPKKERLTFFSMDLYGVSEDLFYVNRGKFKTPTVECNFTARDGNAICNCKTSSIKGFTTD